jgi:hypothetical protein
LVNEDVSIDETKCFKMYINSEEDIQNKNLQLIYKHAWEAPFDKNGKLMVVVDVNNLLSSIQMDTASLNKMILLLR